jgi:hypothetical protein
MIVEAFEVSSLLVLALTFSIVALGWRCEPVSIKVKQHLVVYWVTAAIVLVSSFIALI